MDGRGRALDNIFVERLWRTVKYEDVYIKEYQTIPEAQEGLKDYFDYYKMERRHSSLHNNTPWTVFSGIETFGFKQIKCVNIRRIKRKSLMPKKPSFIYSLVLAIVVLFLFLYFTYIQVTTEEYFKHSKGEITNVSH